MTTPESNITFNEMNVHCFVDEDPVNCTTWEKETVDTKLKERQQLCADLDYLITEDKAIREEIIDEYVYLLDDTRVDELIDLCTNQLGEE